MGPTERRRVAVKSGLAPGDRVVIDGADKLRNGAKDVVREQSASPDGRRPVLAPQRRLPTSLRQRAAPAGRTAPGTADKPGPLAPADPTPDSAAPGNRQPRRGTAPAAIPARFIPASGCTTPQTQVTAPWPRSQQAPAAQCAMSAAASSAAPERTRPMSPSRPFILRPVATTLLMIAIMLSGIVAYRFLPLAALPEVDYPTIQVQTFYPGASPDVMTSSVTAPLEVQLGQMPALNQMSSATSAGSSVITLQFSLKLSLDVAEQEVQAAINAAGNLLPTDLPAPPIYAKVNPADAPILTLGLRSRSAAAAAGRGPRRHPAGAEDFPASGRRARHHQRRPAAGGAHPGRPAQARGLWAQHRRPAHHARQRQRQHAEGQFRRADAGDHHQRQRPAA